MIKKIDHLVITTAHPEACLAFYHALGFDCVQAGGRWELRAGTFQINVHLLGRELEPKAAHIQPGSADLCFELDISLNTCRSTLESMGLEIELGPVTRHGVRGEMTSLYLRDPDGTLVELCSYG